MYEALLYENRDMISITEGVATAAAENANKIHATEKAVSPIIEQSFDPNIVGLLLNHKDGICIIDDVIAAARQNRSHL